MYIPAMGMPSRALAVPLCVLFTTGIVRDTAIPAALRLLALDRPIHSTLTLAGGLWCVLFTGYVGWLVIRYGGGAVISRSGKTGERAEP